MRTIRAFLVRCTSLLRRRSLERNLAQELESLVALETEENLRRGLNAEEARRQALLRIGGIEQIKENYRDRAGLPLVEQLGMDIRYALRQLRKSPGYTLAAVLTLALGIGVNTTMFSIVDAVLLKPLPFPAADRIVVLHEISINGDRNNVSWPDYVDWRAQSKTLTGLTAVQSWAGKVGNGRAAVSATFNWVTASYFPLLGQATVLGRVFGAADDRLGAAPVAVLSHRFWFANFGGDPGVIGRTLLIDEQPMTIVGVLEPTEATGINNGDVFLPIGLRQDEPMMTPRSNHPGIVVLGRMRMSATLASVHSEFDAIMARLASQYPESNRGETAGIEPLPEMLLGAISSKLLILLCAVGFVLLLACANLAHMALGRATMRRREFAIRAATGAGASRLGQQVLTESVLLAFLGAAFAVAIGSIAVPLLVRFYGTPVPGLANAHVNTPVLIFTLALAILATVLFGSAPALLASRTDANSALKSSSNNASRQWNWRGVLITGEVALALVLCIGSVLLIQSLRAVLYVNPGFEPDRLALADILRTAPMTPQTARFFSDVVDTLRRAPEVESASAALSGPFQGTFWTTPFDPSGHSFSSAGTHPWVMLDMILPGYFETLKTPLRAGREFNARDTDAAPAVAIISESAAKMIDPSGNVLGREIFAQYASHPNMRIVGVAAEVKQFSLDAGNMPAIYVPEWQMPNNSMTIAFRFRRGARPDVLLKTALAKVDPDQPVSRIVLASDLLEGGLRQRQFVTALLSAFACLGLLLAVTGVAGVVSYSVSRRTREIGIRLAIGARPTQAVVMVIRQAMLPALFGVAAGSALAFAAARLLSSMLFGVTPHDRTTFLISGATLAGAALLAALFPALRTLRVNAVESLRAE